MDLLLRTTQQLVPTLVGARKKKGLTQKLLADKVGLSQSRVSYLEKNPGEMTLDQLFNIYAVLGLDLVTRLRGSAQPSNEADW